jgi:formate hydrogenlyase transcriptional activator
LLAAELFGYEKGAFTGANQRKLGRFELAHGGTLFLDEIGELSPEAQVMLLRVLQERAFERVGGSQQIAVDVRVIAATNRDLEAAVQAGTFRQDLFYRLNVFPIRVPPLRDRADDIPLLVEYFTARYASKTGKRIRTVAKPTLSMLEEYEWPGNIRELQNVVERAVILCDGETLVIDEKWIRRDAPRRGAALHALGRVDASHEKETIEHALSESRGRVSGQEAPRRIRHSTLDARVRIKSLRINKNRFQSGDGPCV